VRGALMEDRGHHKPGFVMSSLDHERTLIALHQVPVEEAFEATVEMQLRVVA
jgi:hypothetical protein